jgi:hypothetical protein
LIGNAPAQKSFGVVEWRSSRPVSAVHNLPHIADIQPETIKALYHVECDEGPGVSQRADVRELQHGPRPAARRQVGPQRLMRPIFG